MMEVWPVFSERQDGCLQITITVPLWRHRDKRIDIGKVVDDVRKYVDYHLGYELCGSRAPRPRVAASEAKRSHNYTKLRLPKPLTMMGRAGRLKWLCANINDVAAYN